MKMNELAAIEADIDGDSIQALEFAYRTSADQQAATPVLHDVVIVGAGPVGLTLAIDLAMRGAARGQKIVLLDNDNRLSSGSRAICFAKRTLEVWDRLGLGDIAVNKGVSWNVGKVFLGQEQLYQFDLLPEEGHQRPAFINLQQYYAEAYLLRRASEFPNLEIRWKNSVDAVEQSAEQVLLTVGTPDGPYRLRAKHVIACDGSRSPMRKHMGLESKGRTFKDRFLIADLRMEESPFGDGPTERWFYFDPPFHRHQSVLLHRQPDNIFRADFQLGWDADPEAEKTLERIKPRIDAMMLQTTGKVMPFELVWASVYTFQCTRMEKFRHGRVVFAGDSAHGVSPFGARGANSGIQDAENLGWKLNAVLAGKAGDSLLESYSSEREYAADENILNSTRSTDFITPKSEISQLFRDSVLELSKDFAFARKIVNSGRLSLPSTFAQSGLNTPDVDSGERAFAAKAVGLGAPAVDVPLRSGWLLRHLANVQGEGFVLVCYGKASAAIQSFAKETPVKLIVIDASNDAQGLFAQRYDAHDGSAYLFRPDQHLTARWREVTVAQLQSAVARALGVA